jgi:DNA-binding transcriptional LysR family regulator
VNIQQLRYVVATVEHGSMTSAATALFVAQPALSRAVRQLERELGLELFARAGRGVELTADGERFVAGARRALRSLDDLRDVRSSGERDAQLVIAASPTLQTSMALPLLGAMREQGVTLHSRLLGCSSVTEVHELVAAGSADIGICDQTVETALAVVPLGVAEVCLVSPAGLDLPDPITVAGLDGVPLVLPTSGSERRAALDQFFAVCGLTPTVAVESDERVVWIESVLRGLASCIWHSVDSLQLPADGVQVRSFEPPMFQELSAVHREADESPAKLLLLDVLRQLAELSDRSR